MLRLTLWLGCVALAAAAAVPRRRASESLAVLEGLLQQQRDENNNVRINNNSNSYDSGNEDTDARIVGGTIVAPGTYPFFAYGAGTILCGATLIYEDILLTAAHCDGAFIQNGALIGGTQLDGSDATRIEVESELPSPDYDDATRLNDIMLVKLREPSTAPLATLNLDAIVPVEGDPVTVTGFGDTADGGEPSPVLLDVTVDTFSDEFCDALYNVYEPDTMICAGTL